MLCPDAQRLVLLDGEGVVIDARCFINGERVAKGVTMELLGHVVAVGEMISRPQTEVKRIAGVSMTHSVGRGSRNWWLAKSLGRR